MCARVVRQFGRLETITPEANERASLDAIIFDELVYGHVGAAARAFFTELIAQLPCDAVALACTEIPLVFEGATLPCVPLLDSKGPPLDQRAELAESEGWASLAPAIGAKR